MAVIADRPRLDPGINALLGRVRARIVRYVWIEGLAATVATLCAALWLALGLDWFFEPSAALRQMLLGAGLVAAVVVFYRLVLRRLAFRLRDRNLAVLLERRFRYFDDSLLTTIDLSESDRELGNLAREMLSHTGQQAAQHAAGIKLDELFRREPLVRAVSAAVVLALSLAAFAVARPETFRFGVDRLTGATDELWPRDTRLVVPGFENGERVVARGDDLDVLVQADLSMPLVPDVVQLRYRTEEGVRGRETMTRNGNAVPGQDEYQDSATRSAASSPRSRST